MYALKYYAPSNFGTLQENTMHVFLSTRVLKRQVQWRQRYPLLGNWIYGHEVGEDFVSKWR